MTPTPQQQIDDKARDYALGHPRLEIPEPRRPCPPCDMGFRQVFDRGWVYWFPYEARAV